MTPTSNRRQNLDDLFVQDLLSRGRLILASPCITLFKIVAHCIITLCHHPSLPQLVLVKLAAHLVNLHNIDGLSANKFVLQVSDAAGAVSWPDRPELLMKGRTCIMP